MVFHFIKKSLTCYRGLLRRWYRRHFKKQLSIIGNGQWFFQEFSDIYGDTINDIDQANSFFLDFIKETDGKVIVDFLDTDNWDCIRKIKVDRQQGLVWFYWQMPHDDPIVDMMRKMAFPLDYYGICLKFDNVRFIRNKKGKCFGFCVNGYTINKKDIKDIAQSDGWEIKGIDSDSSFFSTNVVRVKDGISQTWRIMNTPISSFWVIPKHMNIYPQDSEKILYLLGVEKCEKIIKETIDGIEGLEKETVDRQRTVLKMAGNNIRNATESLFKLIICFYHETYQFKVKNYDNLFLGDLKSLLKKGIYTTDDEIRFLNDIITITNDLSHDTGHPVKIKDVCSLYSLLTYFIIDFKARINQKGRDIHYNLPPDKLSPKDFVKDNFFDFCFKDEIDKCLAQSSGKISYTFRAVFGISLSDFFNEKEEILLCEDGYFHMIRNKNDVHILRCWSRDESIALVENIIHRIKRICEEKDYDTEYFSLGFTLEAILKKEGSPSHLFNEDEIKNLMVNADDNLDNKLVIDEDGYARLIHDPYMGHLYPVSQETWFAGYRYVGKDSKLTDLHNSYVLCCHLWLSYLKTGRRQYDDIYISDNGIEDVIEKIHGYYE